MSKTKRNATVIAVLILVLVNLVALNWSWRYFRQTDRAAFPRYGDAMPSIGGPDYRGGRSNVSVAAGDENLLIYVPGPYLNGRAVSLIKSGAALEHEYGASGLRFTLIAGSQISEVQKLLADGLINYRIIDDSGGSVARRLGLSAGESATFLFDKSGACRFSVRQQASPDDLRQLLASEGLGTSEARARRGTPVKGQPLPSWSMVDAATLSRTSTLEVARGRPHVFIFFPAECFSCSAPEMGRYLAEFDYWRKGGGAEGLDPVLVFDSAFMRDQVLGHLKYEKVEWPVYLSDDDLTPLARIVQTKGASANHLVFVHTDADGTVSGVGMVKPPDSPLAQAADEQAAGGDAPAAGGGPPTLYRKLFGGLDVDVYDVASYKGLYVVSDRTRNSLLVINDRSEIQKEIAGIGSAPGRLFRPGYLDVASDGVIYVQDGGNERIQSFDLEGRYLGGFPTTSYTGFAAGAGGEVFLGQPEKGKLVTVYSRDGKVLRSFGALKTFSEVYGPGQPGDDEKWRNAVNRVKLSVAPDGGVLVSFMMAPFIQKYTRDGRLVFESRLEGPEIDRLTQMALTTEGGGNLTMSVDGFPEHVMALEAVSLPGGEIDVALTDGSVYVADAEGRKVSVLHPRARDRFTPEMIGLSPAGEMVVVGLSARDCYALPRQSS
jgi:hypothetical protein